MSAGYTGKILRVNMTNKTTSILHTAQYEEYGGGHGIGSAVFWDLCEDKTIDGYDPRNVITIMTSPLSGTLAPGVAGRSEVQGIGVQPYPVGWFTRANFGGRFCGMLKAAGWDGIAVEGAAGDPLWINIINDRVTFEDARGLWGMDTWKTQQEIWKMVTGNAGLGEWLSVDEAQTTQRPAILCIGPAGENRSRSASLIHGSGNGAGQGGFGGIWGAKNLKAISVQGTGSIRIADPRALMDARLWFDRTFPFPAKREPGLCSCQGCPRLCRTRNEKYANGSMCLEKGWYGSEYNGVKVDPEVSTQAGELSQKYGINISDLAIFTNTFLMNFYLIKLYKMGVLGPGKAIDSSPLPFDQLGKIEFAEALIKAISYREGIGKDLAEGPARAAENWGRLEEDLASGILKTPEWGNSWHLNLPSVEWTYGSILGDRDITEHDFEFHPHDGKASEYVLDRRSFSGNPVFLEEQTPESVVELLASKTIPYTDDPFMFNHAWQEADGSNMAQALKNGIYSSHKAKLVAWHRHYTRFWKQSILYCDWMYASFTSSSTPDLSGATPKAEPRFFNTVTGKKMSFAEGMEVGRKIWNLDRAIWILQGRHRDMEKPASFMFKPGCSITLPVLVYKDGKWQFNMHPDDMFLDRDGVEAFKTHFYEFEGWDADTGWPSRSTLEELNLKEVADKLESAGKLGISGYYAGNS